MICTCGFGKDVHWYSDRDIGRSFGFHIAGSPEQAEYYLRSWAARILRSGHADISIRKVAARVLVSRDIHMIRICERQAHTSLTLPDVLVTGAIVKLL